MKRLIRSIRRLLGLRPPYQTARGLIEETLTAGQLTGSERVIDAWSDIERICGWDSWVDGPDIAEFAMLAEDHGKDLELVTVDEFVKLLKLDEERYR